MIVIYAPIDESDEGNWRAVCEETVPVSLSPGHKLRSFSTSEIDDDSALMQNGDVQTITIGKTSSSHNQKPRLGRMSSMTLDRRAASARELEKAKQEIKKLEKQLIEAANVLKTTRKELNAAESEKKESKKKIDDLQKVQQEIQSKLIDAEEKLRVMEKMCSSQVIQIEELKQKDAISHEHNPRQGLASQRKDVPPRHGDAAAAVAGVQGRAAAHTG